MISANKRNLVLAGYVTCPAGPNEKDPEAVPPEVPPAMVLGNCDDPRDIALQA